MRIPEDAIIPDDKITRYLLIPKLRSDKSKFLAQAGFTQENPEALRAELSNCLLSRMKRSKIEATSMEPFIN
jgi:hypothetical protein